MASYHFGWLPFALLCAQQHVARGAATQITLDVEVDGGVVQFTSAIERVRLEAGLFCKALHIGDSDCETAVWTLAAAKIAAEHPDAWIPNVDAYDVRTCSFIPDLVQVKLVESGMSGASCLDLTLCPDLFSLFLSFLLSRLPVFLSFLVVLSVCHWLVCLSVCIA